MRMRRADQDGVRARSRTSSGSPRAGLDRLTADEERVDADDGDPLLAVVEDRRAGLARVVERPMISLAVSAGLLHADRGEMSRSAKPALKRLLESVAAPSAGRGNQGQHQGQAACPAE